MAAVGTLAGVQFVEAPAIQAMSNQSADDQSTIAGELAEQMGTTALATHEGTQYAMVRVLFEQDINARNVISNIERLFADASFDVVLTGESYLQSEIFSYIIRILLTIPPIAILLMLLVFRIRIGSFRATILSLVPAIVGAVITLGAIGWLVGQVSMITVLVPIFVIVLGSADGLHITSHVMDGLREGHSTGEAVLDTLRAVGMPVIMTTVTTMAGFLSMLVINSTAIRELGIAAAVGIVIAGLASWIVLPTILLHQKPLRQAARPHKSFLFRGIMRLRGWPSVLLALGLVAAAVPGILRLRASFSMIDVYKPGTEVRQNVATATDVLGGSIPVYVTFPATDEFAPELADAVLRMQDEAGEKGIAGTTISAYSIVRAVWESASGQEGYPAQRVLARTVVSRIRLSNGQIFDSFFTGPSDATAMGRAVFFLRDLDNSTIGAFEELVARVGVDSGIDLQTVGTAFVMKEMNDQIIPQQLWSLVLAAGLVFLLTSLTQRSFGLGLASTLPILVTLATVFGVMGYARIDLSVVTGIMSGLTIGVGIDYAIHFTALLRQARKRGESDPEQAALSYVATPVLANALGLAVGLTAMLFSPLQIHVTLSILMWVTMSVSAVLSLTLLPTVTGLGRRRRHRG